MYITVVNTKAEHEKNQCAVILSLEIYTNIVINFHNHNTCCYFISAALFCISVYFIIVTLLVVACILHKWN